LMCVLLCAFLTVGKWVDEAVCIPAAARRVGVEPSYTGLYTYLGTALEPGMTRLEV
jgi:hypothetical protein